MNQEAFDIIAPKLTDVCKDKIRRKLFNSDSEYESEVESVNSCPGLIEDTD